MNNREIEHDILTASRARKITNEIRNRDLEEKITARIKAACIRGEDYIPLEGIELDVWSVSRLKELGYTVAEKLIRW